MPTQQPLRTPDVTHPLPPRIPTGIIVNDILEVRSGADGQLIPKFPRVLNIEIQILHIEAGARVRLPNAGI